jgi:hypothetical protein
MEEVPARVRLLGDHADYAILFSLDCRLEGQAHKWALRSLDPLVQIATASIRGRRLLEQQPHCRPGLLLRWQKAFT